MAEEKALAFLPTRVFIYKCKQNAGRWLHFEIGSFWHGGTYLTQQHRNVFLQSYFFGNRLYCAHILDVAYAFWKEVELVGRYYAQVQDIIFFSVERETKFFCKRKSCLWKWIAVINVKLCAQSTNVQIPNFWNCSSHEKWKKVPYKRNIGHFALFWSFLGLIKNWVGPIKSVLRVLIFRRS